jgi:hypothetical protein
MKRNFRPAPQWLRRPVVVIPLVLILILVGIRVMLPSLITRYVNDTLNNMDGYEGQIADVDLHLWRGAYAVHDVRIVQVIDEDRIPVFSASEIDLSMEWNALIQGSLVGQITFYQPRVTIYAGPAKKEQQRDADDLIDRIRALFPFRINRFAVVDGRLHFINFRADPDVDIYLDQVQLAAYNLTNSAGISESLWATVSGEGRAMKSGEFTLKMQLNPTAGHPTYELAFDLKGLRLPELNTFLKHYLSVQARDGWISLYAESTAKEGRFNGYVKPLVRDLDILQVKENTSIGEAIKGFFVKIISAVFENKSKEQLATKIEFSGRFDDPDVSIWGAVLAFLRNAFISALPAGLEGSVAPGQVEEGRPATKGK